METGGHEMKANKTDSTGSFWVTCALAYAASLALWLCACNYFPSATHYKCTIIGDPVSSEILVEGAGGASMDGTLKASVK